MKLLVTGSSGFIGSYFIDKYKNKYDIQTFSFLNNDIKSLDCSNIEIVFHLSALVHKMDGAKYEEYVKVNVKQTIELAKKAKESGVRQFVFMSTVKVYGEETRIAYNEDSKCEPEDDYGITKLMAEKKLKELEDDTFKISIIRTPIVYGYGVKANIQNLVKLINTISVLPFSNIENRRSMVYIGNLCHLVDEVISKEQNGIFLASDDNNLSTTKLIKLIANSIDKKIYLIPFPFFKILLKIFKLDFYKRLYGNLEIDNTITRKKLNFKNPYSIEEGIEFMIKGEK